MPSRFAALAIVLALAACGPRDTRFAPSNFQVHNVVVPRDLAAPNDAVDGDVDYNGLYVGGPKLYSCCWIAPHATLLVRKHRPARTLVAAFWVPDVPFFHTHPQTVKLSFDGTHSKPLLLHLYNIQYNNFRLAIPASLRNKTGLIPITLDSSVTFIPGLDGKPSGSIVRKLFVAMHLAQPANSHDMRHLAVILMYLYFE
jgi:hypothetical protein